MSSTALQGTPTIVDGQEGLSAALTSLTAYTRDSYRHDRPIEAAPPKMEVTFNDRTYDAVVSHLPGIRWLLLARAERIEEATTTVLVFAWFTKNGSLAGDGVCLAFKPNDSELFSVNALAHRAHVVLSQATQRVMA